MAYDFTALSKTLGHKFHNPALLEEALTHPSLYEGKKKKVIATETQKIINYQRLEFLGDAVVGVIVTEFLITEYQHETEGALAKRRAVLVSGETLAKVASSLGLGQFLILSQGEDGAGGRENKGNLADAMEAVIGALYLDGGLDAARNLVKKHWAPLAKNMMNPPRDPKTALQEWAQGHGKPIPTYRVVASSGPAHAPSFTIEVAVEGLPPVQGVGTSKRTAEREAAQNLLAQIEGQKNE